MAAYAPIARGLYIRNVFQNLLCPWRLPCHFASLCLMPLLLYRSARPLQVNAQAVEQFIRVVGEKEDAIFQRRMRMLQRDKRRREEDKARPLLHMLAQHLLSHEGCHGAIEHMLVRHHTVSRTQECMSV